MKSRNLRNSRNSRKSSKSRKSRKSRNSRNLRNSRVRVRAKAVWHRRYSEGEGESCLA